MISSEVPAAASSNSPKRLQGGHRGSCSKESFILLCSQGLVSFHDHWPHVKTPVLTLSPRVVYMITCTLSVGSSWFKHTQAQGVAKNGFSYTKTVLGATRVGQS